MCENKRCPITARILCATSGGCCPYGYDVDDFSLHIPTSDKPIKATIPKSPLIESKAQRYGQFGTGKPKKKWANAHREQLKIE